MNIYARPGYKVRFLGKNGFDNDLIKAFEHLEKGAVYTVAAIEVGNWSSVVWFEENPTVAFNTVMFEDA